MNMTFCGSHFLRWSGYLLDAVFPRYCCYCGLSVGANGLRFVCWDCLRCLDVVMRPYCDVCGDPVDGHVDGRYTCSMCRKRRPPFASARSAVRYRGASRALLRDLKYNGAIYLVADAVTLLAGCMVAHYSEMVFDAVTFVPLHPRRRRGRGFNQSELLARGVARRMRLPCARLARRVRDTPSQTALGVAARDRNMRNAFCAVNAHWIRGRRVLLIDDVMTTGATVAEVSRVILAAGAVDVYVVTVARG